MKRKIRVLLYLGIMSFLVGCEKMPDEVADNMDNAQQEETESDELTFDTLENVLKSVDNIKDKSYDNLLFQNEFEINQPKNIGVIKLRQVDDFDSDADDKLNAFVKMVNPDVEITINNDIHNFQYIDELGKESFALQRNGFLFYGIDEGDSWVGVLNEADDTYTKLDTIYLDTDYEEPQYDWNNKSFSLDDVVGAAADYADEFIKTYDKLDWIPNNVVAYQHDDGQYFFQVNFTKAYDDVQFFYSNYRTKGKLLKSPYVLVIQPYILVNSSMEVIGIDNLPGVIQYEETEEDYDKIITLECATEKVSKLLSSYRSYNVYDISLEYRLALVSGVQMEETSLYMSDWEPGNEYEARPCWTFYLSRNTLNPTFAMVDCLSGEVEFISGD